MWFFKSKKIDSPDTLGVYPEYMQVRALPERRYLKTSRLLAVIIFFCLAFMILFAGLFTYYARRIDVSIANSRVVNLYTINSSRKVLIPAEYATKRISATELLAESIIRSYIQNRHSIVWDNNIMQQRWDVGGPVARYSQHKTVYTPFRVEADLAFSDSRSNGFVRDVHLYELTRVRNGLWEGVFDTFDMPIPDTYAPICNCFDNSPECISCKAVNTSRRQRFRVFLRVNYNNAKTLANPLGFMITSYSTLYVPINEKEVYWGVPSDLKPEI